MDSSTHFYVELRHCENSENGIFDESLRTIPWTNFSGIAHLQFYIYILSYNLNMVCVRFDHADKRGLFVDGLKLMPAIP